jgi:hypothetical protein
MTSTDQIERVVSLLLENAAALQRYAPADAAAMLTAAGHLRRTPAERLPRLLSPAAKRDAADRARAWALAYADDFQPPRRPPTVRQYYSAAKAAPELAGVPISIIRAVRPPEWNRPPGRPRNVPILCNETLSS